jgi:hypothetical protein
LIGGASRRQSILSPKTSVSKTQTRGAAQSAAPSRLQQSSIKQATRKKLKALQSNAFNFFLGSSAKHCRFENIQLRSLFAIMQDIKRELKLWLYLLLFKPLKKLKIL